MYVALSCCTDVNRLYLTNASGDHRFYHKDENPDKSLADEMQRLKKHKLVTVTRRYLDAFESEVDPVIDFTVALLNTRSLRAHAKDIERDPVLVSVAKPDVLCLTETRNACVDIEGYVVAYTHCEQSTTKASGVAIYVKCGATVGMRNPVGGEHYCAADVYGVTIVTVYLSPNLSRQQVQDRVGVALKATYVDGKKKPFVIAGDFNVDVRKHD